MLKENKKIKNIENYKELRIDPISFNANAPLEF